MSTSMTLKDLEPSKYSVLVNLFLRFRAAKHISRVNCAKMAGDRPRQPAQKILALNLDFSSPSPGPL